jgi:hypothetical protein
MKIRGDEPFLALRVYVKMSEIHETKYFCFVTILDMSLISRSCKNDHIIFNVGTPSLEARKVSQYNYVYETAVTWSKSNLNMMNIYEESTINFWIWRTSWINTLKNTMMQQIIIRDIMFLLYLPCLPCIAVDARYHVTGTCLN